MPLNNSLNTAEMLRRLGVKGDSQGSMALLESLRLNLIVGDLSDLVPPVGVPIAGATLGSVSGVATFNKWALQCRSPGGLTVLVLNADTGNIFDIWVEDANPFGGVVVAEVADFSFGQTALSLFSTHVPAAKVAPAATYRIHGTQTAIPTNFESWIGPGEFLNVESGSSNVVEAISILWKEYPGALNPG